MSTNKIKPAVLTAQQFINVEDIDNDFIFTKDGYLIAFLAVKGADNKLLSFSEQQAAAENMAFALKSVEGQPWQILSIPRTIDTRGMIERLAELQKKTSNDAKLKLINGEIATLKNMQLSGSKEPMICIKLWQKAERGADVILEDRIKNIRNKLNDLRISCERMTTHDIIFMGTVFAELSEWQEQTDEDNDIPLLPGETRLITKKSKTNENTLITNLLTPLGGIEFRNNRVVVGSAIGRIYGAMRYPASVDYGWAVNLMNLSNCITSITFFPGNPSELGDALSKSIRNSGTNATTERDARRAKRFIKQAADADKLIEDIDYKAIDIGHISILAMPFTSNEEDLEDVCKATVSKFSQAKIKIRPLGCLQKEAYQQLSPYYTPRPKLDDILRQIIPLPSLMGGFPLTVNTYRDDRGNYFARTTDGNIISIDFDYRGGDRVNSNIVMSGESGQGKSTATKHIIESRYMIGSKMLCIDPEREYRELCKNLDGAWLDIGGGASKINPLQIRPAPEDEEEETSLYQANDNAMALHISTLEVFFSLAIPSLSDIHRAILKRELLELYNSKGIDWQTDVSTLLPEDFPIMSELYDLIEKKSEKDASYKELALLLYDMAYGANSFLWNGYSNVNINSDFIVFDVNKLISASEPVKRAQYFNTLSFCWEIMSRNKTESVTVVADEAHTMLDPAIPQTAMFLRNFAKRARKYEGMLITIVQSISDMLFDEIRIAGQAILDSATYKILFGCDGKTLKDVEDNFNLTEAEKNILLARRRGKALFLMGSQHINVEFDIPAYKLELMGTGGGR